MICWTAAACTQRYMGCSSMLERRLNVSANLAQ
jgi:hypothetical protein